MPLNESAHRFGRNGPLVGVLTHAEESPASRPAVLLLNSGLIHRVGPNRTYVRIARRLAERGFSVFRFDFSGLGDSPPRADRQPLIRSCIEETGAAMDLVQTETGDDRFVLLGVCSGADAALLTAVEDHRVAGVVAINARRYGASDEVLPELRRLALARHYRRIATSRSFGAHSISKLSRGKMGWRDAFRAIRSQLLHLGRRRGFGKDAHVLRRILDRGVPIYCLHSEADEGLDHLHVLQGKRLQDLCSRTGFRLEVMEGANHTFTMRWSQTSLLRLLEQWLEGSFEAMDEMKGRAAGGS